jgi:hypothetical protein
MSLRIYEVGLRFTGKVNAFHITEQEQKSRPWLGECLIPVLALNTLFAKPVEQYLTSRRSDLTLASPSFPGVRDSNRYSCLSRRTSIPSPFKVVE